MRDEPRQDAAYHRLWRARNRERRNAYLRDYYRVHGKDAEKERARKMARRLFPDPEPCEIDGCNEVGERHHDDYSKPEQIRWLCKLHHRRHHLSSAAA